jgi:hypothetical protein
MTFLQAEGVEPLPKLCAKLKVTNRFRARAYGLIMGHFGVQEVRTNRGFSIVPYSATRIVWVDYFGLYEDDIPRATNTIRGKIKSHISSDAHLLNLLQFLARCGLLEAEEFDQLQALLRAEMIGYRLIGALNDGTATLVPISDAAEGDANEADYAELGGLPKAADHFRQAAEEIKSGHFRGSVAESISGVESTIKSLTGKPSVTLGDGLKLLSKDGDLNPALKAGLDKIYGWTNSPSGMRHALSDDAKEVTEAEARFMLSACLAFAAWLKRSFPEA